jgi:uncharacterized protein YndB with AHSA1/START domain
MRDVEPATNNVEDSMSHIHIVNDYAYPLATVWRVLTDPALISRWTTTGQAGRPVGFSTVVGTKFQYVAKPTVGWRGIVDCEVLETREPDLFRYSWRGDENGEVTEVVYGLEPHPGGTRFTYDHTGFTGVGGYFMARLLGRARRKMLSVGIPAVLHSLEHPFQPLGQASS